MVDSCTVHRLISWKHSFRKLNEEYELAKKKKQALDNLLGAGKISQSTHGLFNREIDDAMAEIENQRKALLEKIASKTVELEDQIKTLEVLLATFEIQHVTGEIDEQIYQRETDLLSMGLDTTKQELTAVQEAANMLSSGDVTLFPQETKPEAPQTEGHQPQIKVVEEPIASHEEKPAEETVVETIQCIAETEQPAAETKGEEKQQN